MKTLLLIFGLLFVVNFSNAQSLQEMCVDCKTTYRLYDAIKSVIFAGEEITYAQFQEEAEKWGERVGITYDESGIYNVAILHAKPLSNITSSHSETFSQPVRIESNINVDVERKIPVNEELDSIYNAEINKVLNNNVIDEAVNQNREVARQFLITDTLNTMRFDTVLNNKFLVDLGVEKSCNTLYLSEYMEGKKWQTMNQQERKITQESWRHFFWNNRSNRDIYKYRRNTKKSWEWRHKQKDLVNYIPVFGYQGTKGFKSYEDYYNQYSVIDGESPCKVKPVKINIKKVNKRISYGGQIKVRGKGYGKKTRSNCKKFGLSSK